MALADNADVWITVSVTTTLGIANIINSWIVARCNKKKAERKEAALAMPQAMVDAPGIKTPISALIVNFVLMAFWITFLTMLLHDPTPLTRISVLSIAISSVGAINQFRDLCRLYLTVNTR